MNAERTTILDSVPTGDPATLVLCDPAVASGGAEDPFGLDPLALAARGETAENSRCGFISGYSVLGELGRGGMSVVYQAVQEKLQRIVALKVLTPNCSLDPTSVELFQREAKAVGALNHPNIVTAFDYGEDNGRFFLALEYIDGANCLELIEREGALDERTALMIVRGAILGLSHAHSQGLIHRDVKPANLLFASDGPRDARHLEMASTVKVTDLGLALMEETALGRRDENGRSRIIAGTPAYMAPEQARGEEVDFRADIYGLGATLYHALTGTKPFDAETMSELFAMKTEGALVHPQDRMQTIRTPVVWLLDRMLALRPEHRYSSYEALLADVDKLLEGEIPRIEPLPAGESSFLPPARLSGRPRRRYSDWFRVQEIEDEVPGPDPILTRILPAALVLLGLVAGWVLKGLFGG
ncbi:MAG: serine/threonine-protein kinase [Planctomycetota bacterium]